MYVLGHCATTERTGLFDPEMVYGTGIAIVMMPDYLRSHDWGYDHCFTMRTESIEPALLNAHLLGDWYVHYGHTRARIKRGWAYRTMGVYARIHQDFFTIAEASGLRTPGAPRDSRRGFAHTMVEYAIDAHLARTGDYDQYLAAIVEHLGSLGRGAGIGSRSWILATAEAMGVPIIPELFERDVAAFSRRIECSRDVGEFVLRAAVAKFGLHEVEESIEHVRSFLHPGLDEIGLDAFERVVAQTSDFVRCELVAGKERALA